MSLFIRLHGLHDEAKSKDIREFFSGLKIPNGGVHIVGGPNDEAMITFESRSELLAAMMLDGRKIFGRSVRLYVAKAQEGMKNYASPNEKVNKEVLFPIIKEGPSEFKKRPTPPWEIAERKRFLKQTLIEDNQMISVTVPGLRSDPLFTNIQDSSPKAKRSRLSRSRSRSPSAPLYDIFHIDPEDRHSHSEPRKNKDVWKDIDTAQDDKISRREWERERIENERSKERYKEKYERYEDGEREKQRNKHSGTRYGSEQTKTNKIKKEDREGKYEDRTSHNERYGKKNSSRRRDSKERSMEKGRERYGKKETVKKRHSKERSRESSSESSRERSREKERSQDRSREKERQRDRSRERDSFKKERKIEEAKDSGKKHKKRKTSHGEKSKEGKHKSSKERQLQSEGKSKNGKKESEKPKVIKPEEIEYDKVDEESKSKKKYNNKESESIDDSVKASSKIEQTVVETTQETSNVISHVGSDKSKSMNTIEIPEQEPPPNLIIKDYKFEVQFVCSHQYLRCELKLVTTACGSWGWLSGPHGLSAGVLFIKVDASNRVAYFAFESDELRSAAKEELSYIIKSPIVDCATHQVLSNLAKYAYDNCKMYESTECFYDRPISHDERALLREVHIESMILSEENSKNKKLNDDDSQEEVERKEQQELFPKLEEINDCCNLTDLTLDTQLKGEKKSDSLEKESMDAQKGKSAHTTPWIRNKTNESGDKDNQPLIPLVHYSNDEDSDSEEGNDRQEKPAVSTEEQVGSEPLQELDEKSLPSVSVTDANRTSDKSEAELHNQLSEEVDGPDTKEKELTESEELNEYPFSYVSMEYPIPEEPTDQADYDEEDDDPTEEDIPSQFDPNYIKEHLYLRVPMRLDNKEKSTINDIWNWVGGPNGDSPGVILMQDGAGPKIACFAFERADLRNHAKMILLNKTLLTFSGNSVIKGAVAYNGQAMLFRLAESAHDNWTMHETSGDGNTQREITRHNRWILRKVHLNPCEDETNTFMVQSKPDVQGPHGAGAAGLNEENLMKKQTSDIHQFQDRREHLNNPVRERHAYDKHDHGSNEHRYTTPTINEMQKYYDEERRYALLKENDEASQQRFGLSREVDMFQVPEQYTKTVTEEDLRNILQGVSKQSTTTSSKDIPLNPEMAAWRDDHLAIPYEHPRKPNTEIRLTSQMHSRLEEHSNLMPFEHSGKLNTEVRFKSPMHTRPDDRRIFDQFEYAHNQDNIKDQLNPPVHSRQSSNIAMPFGYASKQYIDEVRLNPPMHTRPDERSNLAKQFEHIRNPNSGVRLTPPIQSRPYENNNLAMPPENAMAPKLDDVTGMDIQPAPVKSNVDLDSAMSQVGERSEFSELMAPQNYSPFDPKFINKHIYLKYPEPYLDTVTNAWSWMDHIAYPAYAKDICNGCLIIQTEIAAERILYFAFDSIRKVEIAKAKLLRLLNIDFVLVTRTEFLSTISKYAHDHLEMCSSIDDGIRQPTWITDDERYILSQLYVDPILQAVYDPLIKAACATVITGGVDDNRLTLTSMPDTKENHQSSTSKSSYQSLVTQTNKKSSPFHPNYIGCHIYLQYPVQIVITPDAAYKWIDTCSVPVGICTGFMLLDVENSDKKYICFSFDSMARALTLKDRLSHVTNADLKMIKSANMLAFMAHHAHKGIDMNSYFCNAERQRIPITPEEQSFLFQLHINPMSQSSYITVPTNAESPTSESSDINKSKETGAKHEITRPETDHVETQPAFINRTSKKEVVIYKDAPINPSTISHETRLFTPAVELDQFRSFQGQYSPGYIESHLYVMCPLIYNVGACQLWSWMKGPYGPSSGVVIVQGESGRQIAYLAYPNEKNRAFGQTKLPLIDCIDMRGVKLYSSSVMLSIIARHAFGNREIFQSSESGIDKPITSMERHLIHDISIGRKSDPTPNPNPGSVEIRKV